MAEVDIKSTVISYLIDYYINTVLYCIRAQIYRYSSVTNQYQSTGVRHSSTVFGVFWLKNPVAVMHVDIPYMETNLY